LQHHRNVLDNGRACLRIDRFLMDRLPNRQRVNKLQQAIDAEAVKVNDKARGQFKGEAQDVLPLLPNHLRHHDLSETFVNIVYERRRGYWSSTSRPAGGASGFPELARHVSNALAVYFNSCPPPGNGEGDRLVHRIDKDTSGLMVVARPNWPWRTWASVF
jgi:23S rRNA pseudouridine1911/1915/1917 synthase